MHIKLVFNKNTVHPESRSQDVMTHIIPAENVFLYSYNDDSYYIAYVADTGFDIPSSSRRLQSDYWHHLEKQLLFPQNHDNT